MGFWRVVEAYGDWLDEPDEFRWCVWRLVWSVALAITVPSVAISLVVASL